MSLFERLEIEQLKDFLEHLEAHPIPVYKQENVIKEGHAWCSDWWTIEHCRAFILGSEEYMSQPSKYLEHNLLHSKLEIVREAKMKIDMLEVFKTVKDFSDCVLFPEIGRGIDIILTSSVKKWKKMTGYDSSEEAMEKAKILFPELITIYCGTKDFDFSKIDEPTILYAHCTRIMPNQKEIIANNKNLLAIINGEIIKKD